MIARLDTSFNRGMPCQGITDVLDTLMQRILAGPLPMTFTSTSDVENLRVLREGGWVRVTFSFGEARPSATVTELTSLGRVAMRYLQTGEDTS